MSVCGSCNTRSTRYDETIQCSACQAVYHIRCMQLTVDKFVEMRSGGKLLTWKCSGCCLEGSGDDVKVKLDKILDNLQLVNTRISSMDNKLQDFTDEIKSLKASQEFLSNKYDEVLNKLEMIKPLSDRVARLEKMMEAKDQHIHAQEERIRHLEQYGRRSMIELREVHQESSENIEDVVVKVVKKMGVSITGEDIEVTHRLKGAKGRPPGIIVALKCRKMKNLIMDKRREMNRKGQQLDNEMIFNNAKGPIYVSDSLTSYYRKLLMDCKRLAKEKGFKYVWYSNEKVLVRRSDRAPVITIHDERDLARLDKSPPTSEPALNVTSEQL